MKLVIIGLGSMGQRRIRLIKKLLPESFICGVDNQWQRRENAAKKWGMQTYSSVSEAVAAEHPEFGFVCTAPLAHASIITECLKCNMHVFTELNLVANDYDRNIKLADSMGRVLFLSSTFLYRDEVKYIRCKIAEQNKPLSYRYHVGQYLPDWHPWESYADYFIGDRRTNGCRELLAIELPWIVKSFGEITEVHAISRKLTTLKTGYNDSVSLLIEHKSGHVGSLLVDVVSRKAVREFELIGEDVYLTWGGTPDSLRYYDTELKKDVMVKPVEEAEHLEGYASFVVENAYTNELKAFFAAVQDGCRPEYSFKDDLDTLALIDRIESVR